MNSVLGFIGSPRTSGNTACLVKRILEGVEDEGANIELYYLNEMDMKGCQGCMYCRNNEICCLDDDFQSVYKEIKSADAIVIGTPIYVHQVSSQTKKLIDRLYPLTDQNHEPRYGEKKLVMAYTQAAPSKLFFWRYRRYLRKSLKDMGLKHYKGIVVPKCFNKDVVAQDDKTLKKAKKLGKSLVKDEGIKEAFLDLFRIES